MLFEKEEIPIKIHIEIDKILQYVNFYKSLYFLNPARKFLSISEIGFEMKQCLNYCNCIMTEI